MEDGLDDALNAMRNVCEPQLGIQISNMDGSSYVGTPPVVNTPGAISQDNVTNEPPVAVKLERVPLNSSKDKHTHTITICHFSPKFHVYSCGL